MKFKDKLQLLRKEKHVTQQQLADHLSISRQAVSKWELGETTPSVDTLKELGALFDVSLDALLGDDELYVLGEDAKKFEEEIFLWFLNFLAKRVKHSFEVEDKLTEERPHRTIV